MSFLCCSENIMRRETILKQTNDAWYVRFPDGKVLHASSTTTVRKNIDRGRIPPESMVRRLPEEEWTTLAWTAEFADLVQVRPAAQRTNGKTAQRRRRKAASTTTGEGGSTSARLDPHKLRTVGVRLFVPELLAALENTVMRRKLVLIASTGLIVGALYALSQYPLPDLGVERQSVNLVLGFLAALMAASASTQLTRATFVELSRLRPARSAEIRPGWSGRAVQLFLAQLLVVGCAVGLILLLRSVPLWLLSGEEQPALAWQTAANVATVVAVVGEVVLWPLLALALLLSPIVVVEEVSVVIGLAHWLRLLRQHPGGVLMYEVLAVGIGLVVTLVPSLPLLFLGQPLDDRLTVAASTTRNVLLGLPVALLFAYLTVANVFIYINLRYEATAGNS